MSELTAICPECDNIIEVENVQEGDLVSCGACWFEGEIEEIDKDGNVWFKKNKEEK